MSKPAQKLLYYSPGNIVNMSNGDIVVINETKGEAFIGVIIWSKRPNVVKGVNRNLKVADIQDVYISIEEYTDLQDKVFEILLNGFAAKTAVQKHEALLAIADIFGMDEAQRKDYTYLNPGLTPIFKGLHLRKNATIEYKGKTLVNIV